MSYNLPDGCSNYDVDHAMEAPQGWPCEECHAMNDDRDDSWPCEAEGCGLIVCDGCVAKCFSCSKAICSRHRLLDDVGDGRHTYCPECVGLARQFAPEAA